MYNTTELFTNYPDVVTIDDLQKMLKVGRNTAYSLLKNESIKTIKVGKKYIIPKINVIKFVTSVT